LNDWEAFEKTQEFLVRTPRKNTLFGKRVLFFGVSSYLRVLQGKYGFLGHDCHLFSNSKALSKAEDDLDFVLHPAI
jgi:hypothetical protein